MNKEQPDLFPRAENPEENITNEPETPKEISYKIQADRKKQRGLKKQIPEELARLKSKLGLDEPGPIFEKDK